MNEGKIAPLKRVMNKNKIAPLVMNLIYFFQYFDTVYIDESTVYRRLNITKYSTLLNIICNLPHEINQSSFFACPFPLTDGGKFSHANTFVHGSFSCLIPL